MGRCLCGGGPGCSSATVAVACYVAVSNSAAHFQLPAKGPESHRVLDAYLRTQNCCADWMHAMITHCNGSRCLRPQCAQSSSRATRFGPHCAPWPQKVLPWHHETFDDWSGGEGTLADFHDAREALAEAAAAADTADGAPASYDYLLACHYDAAGGSLLLAAGSNSGGCALFPVRLPCSGSSAALQRPSACLTGRHTDVRNPSLRVLEISYRCTSHAICSKCLSFAIRVSS